MSEEAPWRMPWPKPRSMWDSDGPKEAMVMHLPGATYHVAPSGERGCDTGRRRSSVECVTCGLVLHRSTTGPSCRIEAHQRERHGDRW